MRHTKEPWKLRDGWLGSIFHKEQCVARCCEPQIEANARRIVACVNALAHIPTEELESGRLQNLVLRCVDAEKQRDELLAELEKVTAKLAWLNSDDCAHIMALTDEAEAAIASVKSGVR